MIAPYMRFYRERYGRDAVALHDAPALLECVAPGEARVLECVTPGEAWVLECVPAWALVCVLTWVLACVPAWPLV